MSADSPDTSADSADTSADSPDASAASAAGESADVVRPAGGSESAPGVPSWDRAGTAALGGALLLSGLRRRSAGGAAMALAGGWLAYRALRGRATVSRLSGASAADVAGESIERSDEAEPISASITVGSSAEELRDLLEDPETMAAIAGHAADVEQVDEERHRWTARNPFDGELSWETSRADGDDDSDGDTTDELRWEVVDGLTVGDGLPVDGVPGGGLSVVDGWTVSFEPSTGDRGTEVTLEIHVAPPGGRLGRAAVERLGVLPEAIASQALDRFKSLAETGEIPTLEGNPSARGRGDLA